MKGIGLTYHKSSPTGMQIWLKLCRFTKYNIIMSKVNVKCTAEYFTMGKLSTVCSD